MYRVYSFQPSAAAADIVAAAAAAGTAKKSSEQQKLQHVSATYSSSGSRKHSVGNREETSTAA